MNFPEPRPNMSHEFTQPRAGGFQPPSVGNSMTVAPGCIRVERATGPFSAATCRRVSALELFEPLVACWARQTRRAGSPPQRASGPFHPAYLGAFCALLVALSTSSLFAATPTPPGKMAFQGFLSDAAGQPLGFAAPLKTNLTFRIYRNATGTAPGDIVWAESQTVVVEQGQYTALLGGGAQVGAEPFTNHLASVFTGADASERFLGVTVGTGTEIRPRIQFFASPFAQFSGAATMLVSAGGNSLINAAGTNVGVNLTNAPTTSLEIGGSLKATNFVGSGAQLTSVSVAAVRLTGTITAAHITDGALTGAKLASPLGTANLADSSVGAAAISPNAIAALAAQVGGIGSGTILVSSNANDTRLTSAGFVNLGPARLDGDTFQVKAFVGAPNAPGMRFAIHYSGEGQGRQSAWTGSKWIIWGGTTDGVTGNYADGRIFDPALGTWSVMSSVNAPTARREIQTAWTGSKMILWGGVGSAVFGDGKLYDPATDKWTNISATGAPSARVRFAGIWTGSEFIVWGGVNGGSSFNDGAIYNPATDTWRPMANSPLLARHDHCAVWTGTEMIVQGGIRQDGLLYDDGARYNPATDKWTPIPFNPNGKATYASAVWTGTEMIVYGGQDPGNVHGGARYNPTSNTWKLISPGTAAFQARYLALVAWTGHEMIIYGGGNLSTGLSDGMRYNPVTDTWIPLGDGANFIGSNPGAGQRLHNIFYTWTGEELMWLGFWSDGGNNAVYSYRPPRAAYLYAKP